jgi:hypothetical protein
MYCMHPVASLGHGLGRSSSGSQRGSQRKAAYIALPRASVQGPCTSRARLRDALTYPSGSRFGGGGSTYANQYIVPPEAAAGYGSVSIHRRRFFLASLMAARNVVFAQPNAGGSTLLSSVLATFPAAGRI